MIKWKSPSSLDIRKLLCLQSKAQKKGGAALVSRMSQVLSEENTSFSQVEIQWKFFWLYRNPVILNLDIYP